MSAVWRDVQHALPFVALDLAIFALSALAAWLTAKGVRRAVSRRIRSRLLRGLCARGAGALVLVAGMYVALRVSGLTQLALTIVGGTGLVGLAVGIAFRDITENYLASIFLSIQRPFQTGDLVEIAGVTGYVRQLNVRTTDLTSLDGTMSQLPNATVYKSAIRNFTINPKRREDFVVGIGYNDRIDEAQEVARRVLEEHTAVLKDPEPWVLVDDLGKATVNLRVYFWLDGHDHSWLKVRSSVIRLIKRAFQEHGISMPDAAREVIFPRGVPVVMMPEASSAEALADSASVSSRQACGVGTIATPAEGGLSSEADALQEQAQESHPVNENENLLRGDGRAKRASGQST